MSEWHKIATAPGGGRKCELRFTDALGYYEAPGTLHYRGNNGNWYDAESEVKVAAHITHWRLPADPPVSS